MITSLSAIPWFELPAAISSSTSRSRGVSRASGSSLRRWREISVETIIGSSAEPPSATRRTAREELVHVADAVLEQVADALGGLGQQLQREPELDVLRQHEHAHRRVLRADLERRAQPLVAVRRRQPDVDDRDVGR